MSLTEERRKEIEAIVEAVSVSLRRDIPVMPYQSALVDVWAALTAAESRAQEQDALIGRLTLLAQAYRSMAAGSSVLYASKMGEELSADLDAVLQEAFPCDCETCESARAVSLTSPRPAGER